MSIIENGTLAAFNSTANAWVLGNVLAYDPKSKTYTCAATDPEPIRQDKLKPEDVYVPRMESLEEDVNDLLILTELHESTILFCLKRRYMRDVVYTNIGPIVIALNPFTFEIPWYQDRAMEGYLQEGVLIERNLPHSWAVAHETYWEMRENGMNQTILISGESGAGKTEGAKIVVKYLGALSTRNGTEEQKQACLLINKRVNAASPILEAFGNAKTVRNDNSSRFGKFMKIQFDKDGFLVGSFAVKYLLEKSRIITASKDERLYHSFYQLACGADMKDYGIRSTKLHRMLLTSDCLTIAGVDDGADYMLCKQAMVEVGISSEEQRQIWCVVAGILFFQNVDFAEKEEKGRMAAQVDEGFRGALTRSSELWGVEERAVEKELTTTTLTARGETSVSPLDRSKAMDTRDSVSKALYDKLFDWLVAKINNTTDADAVHSSAAGGGGGGKSSFGSRAQLWVGLLDIFGFEDFMVNSFEQLCINLANESLQNHYNHHIFTEDLRECKEEGLDVSTFIQFVDNKACIDLLSAKGGIFSLLDEECMVSGTEKNFMAKIVGAFQTTKEKPGHPFFLTVTGKQKDNCFRIHHYAGDVTYVVDGFLDKNRDTLKDAMKYVLSRSTNTLVGAIQPSDDYQHPGTAGGGASPGSPTSRPTAKVTVSGFFIKQLMELMLVINGTNPHWIRCIKPHPAKKPRMFSHLMVTQQLRSAGVLDTVKVRQGGYPIRFSKDVFLMRYRVLLLKEDGHNPSGASSNPHAICDAVFRRLAIAKEMGQLGKTKVFLRHSGFMVLNKTKDAATHHFSLLFQSIARGSEVRAGLFSQYVHMHRARILAERKAREEFLRRQREEEERRKKAAEEERQRVERVERQRRYTAAVTVQRYVRGHLCRGQVVRYFVELMRASNESATDDSDHLRFRHKWEVADRLFRNLEKKENDRLRSRNEKSKTEKQQQGMNDASMVLMTRAAELERRRAIQQKHIKEEEEARVAKLEQRVRSERERMRAEAEEKKKLKALMDAKALEERRKAAKALKEREEAVWEERMSQVKAKKAAELHRLQQRAEWEAQTVANVRREFENPALVAAMAGGRSAAAPAGDFNFERIKNDFQARRAWEEEREELLLRDEVYRQQHRQRDDVKLAMYASGIKPRMPNPGLSIPNAVVTQSFGLRGPTLLSPTQVRRELEYQRRVLAAAAIVEGRVEFEPPT